MTSPDDDARFMQAALALAERGLGRVAPNPAVGCVLVRDGRVVGRGWTQPGGRPHAEQMALAAAGAAARGSTAYVTLEPCAGDSPRGPACAGGLIAAGVGRVVTGCGDTNPAVAGKGLAALCAAGIAVSEGVCADAARALNLGFFLKVEAGRPLVTLKLATSLDGRIALPSGESRWITGASARALAHLERARHDAILVGRGTLDADDPALDVRLDGLEAESPRPFVMSRTLASLPAATRLAARGGRVLSGASVGDALRTLADEGITRVLVEGGAGLAAAFLAEDLVDRLWLMQAPILLGAGRACVEDFGLGALAQAHGRWQEIGSHALGSDRATHYKRTR